MMGSELQEVLLYAADVAVWQLLLAPGASPDDAGLLWHDPMRRVLGLTGSPDDAVDTALRQLLTPLLAAPGLLDPDAAAAADPGAAIVELEHTLRLPRRAERRYRICAAPGRAGNGQPVVFGTVVDVTDAAAAGTAAAPAELRDRYRLLVDLSPDVIVVHCDGNVVFANRAAVSFIGAESVEQILGRSIVSFVSPESIPAMVARIMEMKEEDTHSEPAEAMLMRLDGDLVPVESVSVRTHWEDKPAFQVIMRDLTTQKAAEASMRLASDVVEHVSDAIITTDVRSVVTSWNPAATELYGWREEEAVGHRLRDFLTTANGETDRDSLRSGLPTEVVQRHRDGRSLHVLMSATAMLDDSGQPRGGVVIASDISQRRRAESVRQALDARYSAAVSALDEGVLIIGADGTVETANPAAHSLPRHAGPTRLRPGEHGCVRRRGGQPHPTRRARPGRGPRERHQPPGPDRCGRAARR